MNRQSVFHSWAALTYLRDSKGDAGYATSEPKEVEQVKDLIQETSMIARTEMQAKLPTADTIAAGAAVSATNKTLRDLWDRFAIECKTPENDCGRPNSAHKCCWCETDDCYTQVNDYKSFLAKENPQAFKSVQPNKMCKWADVLGEIGLTVTPVHQPIINGKNTTRNNVIKGWRKRFA